MQLIDAFENGAALCAYCASENCTIAEAMIRREVSRGEMMRDAILAEMQENLNVMRIENPTGTAVLVGWPLNGDFTRALVIPSDEFYNDEEEELPRVLEALEDSLSEL